MKNLISLSCAILLLFLVLPQTGDALHISGTGAWGSFTGTLTYLPVSSDSAVLTIELTNTSPPGNGGYLTAFAFNNPDDKITGVNFSDLYFDLMGAPDFQDGISAVPFGSFDIGASPGGDWQGNGAHEDGLAVDETRTFTFELTGSGLDVLDAWSFVNELSCADIINPEFVSCEWFAVRFLAFDNGESDKVPGDVPVPVTLSAFTATGREGAIEINWISQTEINALSYHLLRAESSEGQYTEMVRLNAAGNSETPRDYGYLDTDVLPGRTYYYKLADEDFEGNLTYHGPVFASAQASLPGNYSLLPNYPNPFNPHTTIEYRIPEAKHVTLMIYNVLGQEIRSLVETYQQAGTYTVQWDARDNAGHMMGAGVYFYTLSAGRFNQTRKMILVR